MTNTAVALSPEIAVLRTSAQLVEVVVSKSLNDLSHADSLVCPTPAGNCINWVVGHLACVYNNSLPLVGERPMKEAAALARYDRGSEPISSEQDAIEFSKLVEIWNETQRKFQGGLEALNKDRMDDTAPFSPTNNPNETVRSLLTTILFHQSYHAGQLGLLRRVIGKAGVIG